MINLNYKSGWYEETKPTYKDFDANSRYWDMKYADRWIQMLPHLPSSALLEPKLLDIGCGLGRASDYFKRYGAVVKGVEPSDFAVSNNRLKPAELIHSDFLTAEINDTFDIVYIEQALSHIPEPRAVLTKIKGLMHKDSIFCIEEPNDYSPIQKRTMKMHGCHWISEDHCNYWNFDSMQRLLENNGFEVLYKTGTFAMELFELMGMGYIGNEDMGKTVHEMRTNMMHGLGQTLRIKLKEKLAEMGLGRDVFFIVKKKKEEAYGEVEWAI